MSCVHCCIQRELSCRVSPSFLSLLGCVAPHDTSGTHRGLRSETELDDKALFEESFVVCTLARGAAEAPLRTLGSRADISAFDWPF